MRRIVLVAERADVLHVRVSVASPRCGASTSGVRLAFADTEASALRASFQAGGKPGPGRMPISRHEATLLGKRLAQVLPPPGVFRLLVHSPSLLPGTGRARPARLAGPATRQRLRLGSCGTACL